MNTCPPAAAVRRPPTTGKPTVPPRCRSMPTAIFPSTASSWTSSFDFRLKSSLRASKRRGRSPAGEAVHEIEHLEAEVLAGPIRAVADAQRSGQLQAIFGRLEDQVGAQPGAQPGRPFQEGISGLEMDGALVSGPRLRGGEARRTPRRGRRSGSPASPPSRSRRSPSAPCP